eukprot:6213464-Pleurochrysis_carterae.AAC.5
MVSIIRGNRHHVKVSCQSDASDWAARVALIPYLGPTYIALALRSRLPCTRARMADVAPLRHDIEATAQAS